jgi:hypothetical protein
VISVSYEKPEVVLVAPAIEAIQGPMDKGIGAFDPKPTNGAYAADED